MDSPPTSPRLLQRRDPVPLLLSSFPAPPTHIPVSPLSPSPSFPPSSANPPSSPNPPPSAPPASPLPPVPGPSPISEHDTLMFMSAARTRRASKLSLASSGSCSKRDSTATLASILTASNSNISLPSLSPSGSLTQLDSSNRSLRSLSSTGSHSFPTRYGSDKLSLKEPRICEEEPADLTRMSLDEITPDHEFSDAEGEDLLEFGLLQPSLSRALQEDELEDIRVPHTLPPSLSRVNKLKASSSSLARQFSVSKLNKELPPIPSSSSRPPEDAQSKRAESPDIRTILASTPKPHRKSAVSLGSAAHRSRSGSRTRRSSTRTGPKRRVSEGQVASGPITITIDSLKGRRSDVIVSSELPYVQTGELERHDNDSDDSDYGVALDGTGTALEIFDKELEDRLERQLEGDGSDSDSSIDIHTPLPHLMLRDGLLSPNSKLLPQSSRAGTPLSMISGRPGSMMSVASTVMTKSGIYKDQRDTVQRRVRHRDGRLLRGGIGLTTGLGWSDSEDEDAPSPLTTRLSSLTLSRSSSSNSVTSKLSSSRSVGEGLRSARSAAPPSSWQHSSLRTSGSSTSTDSFNSGGSIRTSVSSQLSVSTSRRTSESTALALDHIHEHEETASSSASTASLPMPVTPADDLNDHSWSGPSKGKTSISSLSSMKTPSLRRIPSGIPSRSASGTTKPSDTAVRKRTISSSSNSSLAASSGSHAGSSLPTPMQRNPNIPRPLRLPSLGSKPPTSRPSVARSSSESQPSSRTATSRIRTTSGGLGPVPSSRLARPSMPQLLQSQSASTLSSSQSTPPERPKPRTGTGMVYRTSTTRSLPGSARPPGTSLLRPPASAGLNRGSGFPV
ncbi:unnamed protein product [Somion occarium]|uniref:Uncharacterized protein n=1 Tax=Somion occarium TaxID=3059160 RepID=A0ABP1DNH0_9APHY